VNAGTPPEDDLQQYVRENRDLLTRVLLYGNEEARGFALAVLANGGTDRDIERVQRELERLEDGGE